MSCSDVFLVSGTCCTIVCVAPLPGYAAEYSNDQRIQVFFLLSIDFRITEPLLF